MSWLCSKGYVAAGINYTLRNQENPDANVYTQSIEIKEAVPKVIEEAEKHGCLINEMAVAGGSAGHTLAMLYAYRDADSSPVPVRLLFGVMGGVKLTPEMIKDGSYIEKLKPVSAVMWIHEGTVPSVVAYGKYDKVQPFKGSRRLLKAYRENKVDHQYFECSHSGHGLQNDSKVYKEYMETVEKYLKKYLPVK